jgi:hypothetical protein
VTKEFLLDFYCFDIFLNLFAIKAKPSMGSFPLMLNLLWDDHQLCHIKKMKKKTLISMANPHGTNVV